MATMHINNKFEVTFRELIKHTEEKGGRPKEITVTPNEGWEILNEIRSTPPLENGFDIKWPDSKYDFALSGQLLRGKDYTMEEANTMLNKWLKGVFTITFDGIEVRVKPEKPKPKFPENDTIPAPTFDAELDKVFKKMDEVLDKAFSKSPISSPMTEEDIKKFTNPAVKGEPGSRPAPTEKAYTLGKPWWKRLF